MWHCQYPHGSAPLLSGALARPGIDFVPSAPRRLLALSCTQKVKYQHVEEQGAFLGAPFNPEVPQSLGRLLPLVMPSRRDGLCFIPCSVSCSCGRSS